MEEANCQSYLNHITQQYDKVLLLSDGTAELFAEFVAEMRKRDGETVLVQIFSELNSVLLKELLDYYYMYSFADNFIVVDESCPRVATILNFVSTGVLNCEEAWRALTTW